jgi:tripartite-type tricarboxylate transporter receptor subunit TctC
MLTQGPMLFDYQWCVLDALTMQPIDVVKPEVPVPGYEASSWYGVGAPKATPAEIIDKLNKEINAALADPKNKARLANLGGDALALSPADFSKLIADETEKWGKLIRTLNIKAE